MKKNLITRTMSLSMVLMLLLTSVFALFHPKVVHAAVAGVSLDRSVITYDGHTYFDSHIDSDYTYVRTDDNDGCPDTINNLNGSKGVVNTSATLNVLVKDPINGGCTDTKSTIPLQQSAQSDMPFVFVDATHIMTSDGKTTYTYDTALKLFLEDGGDKCKDTLQITAGSSTSGSATVSVTANTSGDNIAYQDWANELKFDISNVTTVGDCTHYGPKGDENYKVSTAFIRDPSLTNPAIAASKAGGGSTGSSSDNLNLNCQVRWKSPLTWFICPMVDLLQGFINWFDNEIDSLLSVNPAFFTTDGTSKAGTAFYQAWSSMRTIALVLLLIFGLIMVISQAISTGPFDAYTVRKILPRIIVAVIGVALSWQLMTLAVTLTNELGNVVKGIIEAPFSKLPLPTLTAGTLGVFSAGAGLVIIGTSFLAAFSFLLTAALAVIVAFSVMILRQIVIVLLVMVAPIAIICYILPNTERVWKLWWESFSKALLMYPIIVAFIASGRVFARAAASVGAAGGNTALYQIIAFVAYFIPYFMLPATFRMAGGAMSAIGNVANSRAQGGFNSLKKFRGNQNARKRAYQADRYGRRVIQTRSNLAGKLKTAGSADKYGSIDPVTGARVTTTGQSVANWARRRALGRGAMLIGGHNIEAQASNKRAQVQKEIEDQINNGKDDEVRALTVDRKTQAATVDAATGERTYKTLGGGTVSEADVIAAEKRWGNDTFAQQAALSYEMRKATTDEEIQGVATGYSDVARGWGMDDDQASGAWIGAAFQNQNQHLEYKHTDWKSGLSMTGQMDNAGRKAFAREMYEKRGAYPLAQMNANTFKELQSAFDEGDEETKKMVQAVAESFVSRYGSGGGIVGMAGEGEGEVPLRAPTLPTEAAGGVRQPTAQVNVAGAPHTAEQVRGLAVHVGVYQDQPAHTGTTPTIPPPDIPRQK